MTFSTVAIFLFCVNFLFALEIIRQIHRIKRVHRLTVREATRAARSYIIALVLFVLFSVAAAYTVAVMIEAARLHGVGDGTWIVQN